MSDFTPMQAQCLKWVPQGNSTLCILNGMGSGSTYIANYLKEKYENVVILDMMHQIATYDKWHLVGISQNTIICTTPKFFIENVADKLQGFYSVVSGYTIRQNPHLLMEDCKYFEHLCNLPDSNKASLLEGVWLK